MCIVLTQCHNTSVNYTHEQARFEVSKLFAVHGLVNFCCIVLRSALLLLNTGAHTLMVVHVVYVLLYVCAHLCHLSQRSVGSNRTDNINKCLSTHSNDPILKKHL